ncbi:MAG: hypothetical protein ACPG77_10600 [Nannocystaceae bacterium]
MTVPDTSHPTTAATRSHGPYLEPRPDVAGMLQWLQHTATHPDGRVDSWVNAKHPGYAYPEAAGLLLTLLAATPGSSLPLRQTIAERLIADISPTGALGRGNHGYAFDTAIALHGLHAHVRTGGEVDPNTLTKLYNFVATCITQRCAGEAFATLETRWSTSWSCHLLKMALALEAHAGHRAGPLIEQLFATLLPLAHNGRFVTHRGSDHSYVHASCYALEGLLHLQICGRTQVTSHLQAGLQWLAAIQADNGSLPAWHNGHRGWGLRPADIVAQSVRLWSTVDREGFATPIARGLRYLAGLQTPSGGLRYHPGSDDVNTWSTIFAVQAVDWARHGPDLSHLA